MLLRKKDLGPGMTIKKAIKKGWIFDEYIEATNLLQFSKVNTGNVDYAEPKDVFDQPFKTPGKVVILMVTETEGRLVDIHRFSSQIINDRCILIAHLKFTSARRITIKKP